MNETGIWTIEAQSFGIIHNLGPLEQASHDFWVIRRPDGSIFMELHGLAADSSTGGYNSANVQDVGFFDELGFFFTGHRYGDTANRDSVVVYQGTEEDVMARYNAAVSAMDYLNNLHIPYNFLGIENPNSNSAFHIIGEILGLQYVDFSGVWEPGLDRDLQNILNNYATGHATPQNLGNTNEILVGTSSVDTLHGQAGNDYLTGNGGNDVLIGDQGNDSLIGGDGNDELFGGAGEDLLIAGKDNDTLDGGQNNDKLLGGQSDDTLKGGTGNDTLEGGEGIDTFIYASGDGFDAIADRLAA